MAASAADFHSSQVSQQCFELASSVARPILVIIGAPGSFEGRSVRCFAGAGVPFVTFARESGRTHTKLGKGRYGTGAPYSAGIATVAAG
jgi:hypothetical protein